MIDPKEAEEQATVLRRAANESPVAEVRGRLIHLANEFKRAAGRAAEEGRQIVSISAVLPGMRIIDSEGEAGMVTAVFVNQTNGSISIKTFRDQADKVTGEREKFAAYHGHVSPVVIEEATA